MRAGVAQATQLPRAILYPSNWDDWFSFETKFALVIWDEKGIEHQPGSLKIGQRGLAARRAELPPLEGYRTPNLPPVFDQLPEQFFSLGQSENFYETVRGLSQPLRTAIFTGLRDVAADLDHFEEVRREEVMTVSLLRDVPAESVRGRYHRLAMGDTRLTEYYFQYSMPRRFELEESRSLDFHVQPHSSPPTNVHVLIGRNGVGKTRLMRGVAQALIGRPPSEAIGTADIIGEEIENTSFAGLVLVSFSAFDDFDLSPSKDDRITALQVGLPPPNGLSVDGTEGETSFLGMSANAFAASLEVCKSGPRAERWLRAVGTLEADELFAQANAGALLTIENGVWREQTTRWFKRLSSGHAIVLLTMTRLVELVDERTLVLLDEPEAHLHPPLLAAFVRALSDLLVNRNGVAIVATHSPVVLQEVPRSCTWILRRFGTSSQVERPSEETFGQNVATLTREVFGLEINKSGFHKLVADAANVPGTTYEAVLTVFGHQLGAEGRALARALVAERLMRESAR